LKERTKKFFSHCWPAAPGAMGKSLFASFSTEKEDSSLPGALVP
jgi:hypothetical protein